MTTDTVKRVAIKKDGYFHILYQLNTTSTLSEVVKDICAKWTLNRPEQYALQYLDSKLYITEENRAEIRDGDILTVTFNVELAAARFLSDIEQPDQAIKRKALDELAGITGPGQAEDSMFAKEFVQRNGITALVRIIESVGEPNDVIAQSMAALQELLEHGFISWDQSVNPKFLDKVLAFANKPDGGDPRVIQKALSLLDNIVTVSKTLFVLVMNKVVIENIIHQLKSNDPQLQLSAVSLINSIMARMEHENRKKFSNGLVSKGYTEILQKVISTSAPLSSEMNHQLYIYQSLLLSMLEPLLNTKPDPHDTELNNDLMNIYNIAFDSASKERALGRPDFKKLGFENGDLPLKDFEESPPGVLACEVMVYFASKHQDQYVKIILENSVRDEEYQCPFGRCTKQLTKMLAESLNVGAPISETSEEYQPMFFSSPHCFQELYSVTVQLLNKTWKEMRATAADFNRVISVVKDQIKRVLNEKPETIDKLKTKAFSLTYQQFLKLMQQEAQERNILDSQTKPVMELREQVEPEIRELVRQQRLAQLVEGEYFKQVDFRGKFKSDKYWYCCLSSNHRFLHYATDLSGKDNTPPSIDALPHKLPLADVSKLELGKDSTHLKAMKKNFVNLTFSLFHGQEEQPLDFVAPNEQMLYVWVDGLSSLLGKEMISKAFQEDLDMLLNMEMKLRLLDLEDVPIPDVPPPVPREPDNYDFFYGE
ncbi:engulfment and cell motility protein 1-like [Clytia hemisphaerica]